jgi:hypothetical protein
MGELTRVTGKVFGETASPTGDASNGPYIGQFGSAQTGEYIGTGDIATIQAKSSAWANGWIDAVTPTNQYPSLPERTGVDKVLSYQECYLLQRGVAEWDEATDYYTSCFCSHNGIIYKSLIDNNVNIEPGTNVNAWAEYPSQIEDWANQDLSNLTISGNARLQYVPFSIVKGTVSSGENATLRTNSAVVYRKRDINVVGTLSYSNNTQVSGFSSANRCYSTYYANYSSASTLEFQVEFTTGSNVTTTQNITGGVSNAYDRLELHLYDGKLVFNVLQGSSISFNVSPVTINTQYVFKVIYQEGAWKIYLNNEYISQKNYDISNLDPDYIGFGVDYGNGSYGHPFQGSINLDNTYLKLDNTLVWSGVTNANSSDPGAWQEGAGGSLIYCDPCTVITCDGRIVDFGNTNTLNISSYADGKYDIFKNLQTEEIVLINSFSIGKTNANNTDYWLDISQLPAQLKHNGVVDNDLVKIGYCTLSSGIVAAIDNLQFNMNGFFELSNLPDFTKTISTSSTYTAETNGWIVTSNQVVRPVYKGETFSMSSGQWFAPMKGY